MICKRKYQVTNGEHIWKSKHWKKHLDIRLFHTYLCCLENMNKNSIIVSPNIPKIIIKNHGNWKSEIHKNNILLIELGIVKAYFSLSFFM